ncbi:hypothetical protein HPB48_013101 [Haemaphysalis longicornis]|uniref:5'-nucleotidase n=1 Tax=Haemaphysalis longicornis TaxID=44386 RepID=A0A9J6G502_HAELO|nr:hypothetical protein HPB48_013101 [Haemaphysalis longicornis]
MLKIVNKYKPNVTRALGQRIGYSKVYLEQEDNICRLRECNLGNLMTDAYFAYYADKNSTDPSRWSDVNGAVLNGGTIRAPLPQGGKNSLGREVKRWQLISYTAQLLMGVCVV